MDDGMSDDRICLSYNTDEPVDLEELTSSFSAVARQYRRSMQALELNPGDTSVRLFVTKLESGSVEAEIATALVAFGSAIQAMDCSLIFSDFTMRIKRILDYFTSSGERPSDLTRQDCVDIKAFLSVVTGRPNSSISIKHAKLRQKTRRKDILMEFEIMSPDIDRAKSRIRREIEAFDQQEPPHFKTVKDVLMYWHQTNVEDAKTTGQRSMDKAVIEAISPKPLSVFFPPQANILKRRMTTMEGNPFKKAFVVDVNVQYARGEPRLYTILELHQVIDLDDEKQSVS